MRQIKLTKFSRAQMASKKEKFKKYIWYAIFIALVVVTITQLMSLFDNWDKRPFDTIVDHVSKQSIPYPSVTICPAGIWHMDLNSDLSLCILDLLLNKTNLLFIPIFLSIHL